jgi:hypothetical protein
MGKERRSEEWICGKNGDLQQSPATFPTSLKVGYSNPAFSEGPPNI